MKNGWTDLQIFDRGTITGDRHCQQVIFLFLDIGAGFIFMDRPKPAPHVTRAAETSTRTGANVASVGADASQVTKPKRFSVSRRAQAKEKCKFHQISYNHSLGDLARLVLIGDILRPANGKSLLIMTACLDSQLVTLP
ncbi:hypothetical protein AVEN_25707-1 [Araneus ventricosus]|uniref:Uncharacterized protein n=1 Tax=Araneus ventricosus TaxID=182803 RepID=A0A4Y2TT94_ARAVE|nr:hypothetical protein AVEN_25707-1 [Araneus ventricosus]